MTISFISDFICFLDMLDVIKSLDLESLKRTIETSNTPLSDQLKTYFMKVMNEEQNQIFINLIEKRMLEKQNLFLNFDKLSIQ